MSERLAAAFKRIAEQLPEYEQDALADRLLKLIESDERDWDLLFESSADQLEKLADRALAEYSAGRAEVLDPNSDVDPLSTKGLRRLPSLSLRAS
ncbi:MAG: hypothetical protein Q7S58_15635 [Candidatus Binatus sp.]|nr:hypothetical protein [Candidatus Binatus sp.]